MNDVMLDKDLMDVPGCVCGDEGVLGCFTNCAHLTGSMRGDSNPNSVIPSTFSAFDRALCLSF